MSVFITRGMSLRIPAGAIRIPPDGSEVPPVKVHVAIDMCPFWLEIALARSKEANAARAELENAVEANDDKAKSRALEAESLSGMQAILGAATAIEALYGSIKPHTNIPPETIDSWRANGTARYKQVAEVLRRGFELDSTTSTKIRNGLRELYRFRDRAVHPSSGFEQPRLHPLLNVGVEWRFVSFGAESAHEAVKFSLTLVSQLLRNGENLSDNEKISKASKRMTAMLEPVLNDWEVDHKDLYPQDLN